MRGLRVLLRSILIPLESFGIVVGKDLSVISFDADPTYLPLSITTIASGTDELGHRVFHLLQKDLPRGRSGSGGYIEARAQVIERGSVVWRQANDRWLLSRTLCRSGQ